MSRNVLESLIVILISLTFGMVVSWPKYQDLQDLKIQAQQKKVELKNKEDYYQALKETSAQLKNYETNLNKVKSALPNGPSVPALANFLQSISSQSGLILKNLSYGSETAIENNFASANNGSNTVSSNYKKLEISLSLSGSYGALKDFLSRLEKSSRIIEVKEIIFTSPVNKEKTLTAVVPSDSEGISGGENATEKTYEFTLKIRANYY